ncbi:MAG: hypothetical protein ACE5KU_00460 [Nitrososphaerales archaeon]
MAYGKYLGLTAGGLLVISGLAHVGLGLMLGANVGVEVLSLLFVLGALFLISGGTLLWRTHRSSCYLGIGSAALCLVLLIIFAGVGMMAAMLISYPVLELFQMPMFILMGPVNVAIIALAAVAIRGLGKANGV